MYFEDTYGIKGSPLYPNYAAENAQERTHFDTWLNRFPWLTWNERSPRHLADHPAFPGVCAEDEEYDAFAVQLRRDSLRLVPCVYQLSWGKVRGAFDLVSGAADLLDNGVYTLGTELPDVVDIIFDEDDPHAVLRNVHLKEGFANVGPVDSSRKTKGVTFGEIMSREARPLSTAAIGNIVEHLARVGKLPPVTASVNGKRFGTYHPL